MRTLLTYPYTFKILFIYWLLRRLSTSLKQLCC
uniref:Uncharacterized protein n=1 Tax=Microviridae sp. ctCVC7 TaxID=2826729 RepID=A0A8S5M2U5_9VIRU|nr:MAG TPA: hypothetical protein [Microviridae sp. ctCVC7]